MKPHVHTRRRACRTLFCAALLAVLSITGGAAQAQTIRLTGVRADRRSAPQYERVTFEMNLAADYANPFDSAQIRVDADVVTPSGKRLVVPGFFYQDYRRTRRDDAERLDETGVPGWQVRFSGMETGEHTVTIRARTPAGEVRADPVRVNVTLADAPGHIRRTRASTRYFVTDRGESYYPVGLNLAWGWGEGRTYDYDLWLTELAKNRANYVRLWLAPHDNPHAKTFALYSPYIKFNRFDLENAWRLDHVMETAERLGIRAMLCVNTHSSLITVQKYRGLFEDLTLHRTHGGPLTSPREFWTNDAATKEFRDRLRYVVARWGYSPAVFAWELWNEVDLTDGYDYETVSRWHRETNAYLRALDPWRHLVTTSNAKYRNPLPAAETLDLYQDHSYQWKDDGAYGDQRAERRTMPYIYGEFGIPYSSVGGATIQAQASDPAALHLHNAVFASVGQAQSGTPVAWFWYNYLTPEKHYPIYKAFAGWIDGFDFVRQNAEAFTNDEARTDSDNLTALGVRGRTQALVWVWNRAHNYEQVGKGATAPVEGATLRLAKLTAGEWNVEFYDTAAGRMIDTRRATADADGDLRLPLPAISSDIALRLRRSDPPRRGR